MKGIILLKELLSSPIFGRLGRTRPLRLLPVPLIPTFRGICRDEHMWEDPTLFNPERFLRMSGVSQTVSEWHDPRNIVFGYGRRLVASEC